MTFGKKIRAATLDFDEVTSYELLSRGYSSATIHGVHDKVAVEMASWVA